MPSWKRNLFCKATDNIWAMAAPNGLIGLCLDSGDSGTVYLTKDQARTVIATLQKVAQLQP
jgi:hypothetical protein